MTDQSKPNDALDIAALLEGTTPGPWVVEEQRVEGGDPDYIGDRNNAIWRPNPQGMFPVVALGNVRSCARDGAWVPMCSISPADARLIAAAPQLAREHIALTDALAVANARMGWQPIKTAPRDGSWFLACATQPGWGAAWIVRFLHPEDRLPIRGEGVMWPSEPTHWMPLPASPDLKEPTK